MCKLDKSLWPTRVFVDFLVCRLICGVCRVEPVAADDTLQSLPQGVCTQYYQWDLSPYQGFMLNSSCRASMR